MKKIQTFGGAFILLFVAFGLLNLFRYISYNEEILPFENRCFFDSDCEFAVVPPKCSTCKGCGINDSSDSVFSVNEESYQIYKDEWKNQNCADYEQPSCIIFDCMPRLQKHDAKCVSNRCEKVAK